MIATLAGLGAGALHVVSGPDHLAAIGPVAARSPERAAGLGALWGVGHGTGVLLIAAVARAGVSALDVASASHLAELAAGVVLVLLGVRALRRVHDHTPHAHPVAMRGALGVGFLHGAAGAHHLLVVLPSLMLDWSEAAAYLGAYLVAAVATMAGVGALLTLGMRGRREAVRLRIHRTLGAAAVLTGFVWIGISLG